MKKLVTKIIIFIVAIIFLHTISLTIEPLVTADLSIKGQLADSDTAYASYSMYQKLLNFKWLVYVAIGLLVFRKDIKKFRKEENK